MEDNRIEKDSNDLLLIDFMVDSDRSNTRLQLRRQSTLDEVMKYLGSELEMDSAAISIPELQDGMEKKRVFHILGNN